ncbi:MAG: phosphate/phosphite/phosphonate ABC transporter substrate-binding protein [Desulfovermiculus sp.]|nr:phosphate/phosphite/phosphonate ABC transporter substrate-binding protein [Desulfovermiculus sp.]
MFKKYFFYSALCLALTLYLSFTALCPPAAQAETGDPLEFLIVPVERETAMFRQFLPLKNCLEKRLDRAVNLKLGHDARAAVDALRYNPWDLAYMDPALYCEIKDKYQVQPIVKLQRGGRDTYKSALVVKDDSHWGKLADIRGASLALGRPGSSATHLIPLSLLHQVDLTLSDLAQVSTLPNEDEIALSVLVGDHDVGAVSMDVYEKYAAEGLRILKASEEIPQFIICAAPHVNRAAVESIRKALLQDCPLGQERLSFGPVRDREYNIVRIMLKNITGQDYLTYPPGTVKFGLLPLYSAITLNKRFTPLAAYLSQKTGRDFRLVIPKDFEEFVSLVRAGEVDFAYQNPYVYLLLAREGYVRSLALTVSKEPDEPRSTFRGVIITRHDSAVRDIHDLPGKRIMIVSHKSAGGYRFQKLFLRGQGIEIEDQAELVEGKRHEEVALAVYKGEVEVGFMRESALGVVQDLLDMDQIRVVARTPYYPNWPVAVHAHTDNELAGLVQEALISLQDTELLHNVGVEGFTQPEEKKLSALQEQVEFQ